MVEKKLIIRDLSEFECNGEIKDLNEYEDGEGISFEIREQTTDVEVDRIQFTIYICLYTYDENDEYEPIKGWHHDDFDSIEEALKFIWENEC